MCELNGDSLPDLLIGRHAGVPEAYLNQGGLRFVRDPSWGRRFEVYDHHATVVDDFDQDGRPDFYFVVGADRGSGRKSNSLYLSSGGYGADSSGSWGVADPFGRGRGGLCLDAGAVEVRDLLVFNWRTAMRVYSIGPARPLIDRAKELFGLEPAHDDSVVWRYTHGDSAGGRERSVFVTSLLPQDLNEDGHADFLQFGVPPARILEYQGGAYHADLPAFPARASVPEPVAGAWGDFDGDGHADLYVVYGEDDAPRHFAETRRNRLLLWRNGRLTDEENDLLAMNGWGVACAAGDIDGDCDLDLVVLQGNRAARRCRVQVARNHLQGTFSAPENAVGPGQEWRGIAEGVLLADLDADGDLDILVTIGAISPESRDGGVRLLRNDCSDRNSLSVIPRKARRVAYGARLELKCGNAIQVRQCWPTQVSGSSAFVPMHFGMGGEKSADLTVVWPSGKRSRLENLRGGRVLTVQSP